jgi:hypothetical protein
MPPCLSRDDRTVASSVRNLMQAVADLHQATAMGGEGPEPAGEELEYGADR